MKKKLFGSLIMGIFILFTLGTNNYATPKSSKNKVSLKQQIQILQSQLKEKTNDIKNLQNENKKLKNEVSKFPSQIAVAKAMGAASVARSVPPPPFFATQLPLQQLIIDGKDFTPDYSMNKFVCVYTYSGKQLLNNNVYLPMDVVGQILNKTFEWDSQNKTLYFGEKLIEDGNK